jgi:hypothetical protein
MKSGADSGALSIVWGKRCPQPPHRVCGSDSERARRVGDGPGTPRCRLRQQ